MEDQLVSFQIAKLAKEKGFPQDEQRGFLPSGKVTGYPETDQSDIDGKPVRWQDIIAAPTQSVLAKWLREQSWHYIVEWDNGNNGAVGMWFFKYRNTLRYPGVRTIKFWLTFEEATDDALLHILNLL